MLACRYACEKIPPPMQQHFALPLFSLIDRSKVDPNASDLQGLAAQLSRYLAEQLSIQHTVASIEGVKNAAEEIDLYLLITEVPQENWPALLALVNAQQTTLFVCVFSEENPGQFTLTPLRREGN